MGDPQADYRPRMLVLGVGGSGCLAVQAAHRCEAAINCALLDTDEASLSQEHSLRKIPVGKNVTGGMSTGGDAELGRQSIEKDLTALRAELEKLSLLAVVAGLGGGTGSGVLPVIARLAREARIQVLVMASLPFGFEGEKRRRTAESSIQRIRLHADAVVRIPNERIKRLGSDATAEKSFTFSHQVMCDAVLALWRICSRKGLCGLDFSSIQTILRQCDGFCHFASGVADGEARAERLTEALIKHPLMHQGLLWKGVSGAVVALRGGADFRLSEVECIMERLIDELPDRVWLNFGVDVDEACKGVAAAVLLAEQWKKPLIGNQRSISSRYAAVGQGELALEAVGKEAFVDVDATVHNNQDIDVPAYIRRKVKLPR